MALFEGAAVLKDRVRRAPRFDLCVEDLGAVVFGEERSRALHRCFPLALTESFAPFGFLPAMIVLGNPDFDLAQQVGQLFFERPRFTISKRAGASFAAVSAVLS